MIIEQLSSLTVKVSVSASELYEHNVDFNSLENDDKNTRSLVSDVINQINIKLGLNFFNEHLYIEAFANRDSGCILYISVVNSSIYDDDDLLDFDDDLYDDIGYISDDNDLLSRKVIMFETSIPRSLVLLAVFLDRYYHDCILTSSLYYSDNVYRMIVTADSSSCSEILKSGFQAGISCISSDIDIYKVSEYSSSIFEDTAIDKLCGKMSF